MKKYKLITILGLILGVTVFAQVEPSLAVQKNRLSEDYYRLVKSDLPAAQKIRDQYMALVNKSDSNVPFFSYAIGSQWPKSLDEKQFPTRAGKFPQLQGCEVMIEAGSDILKIEPSKSVLLEQGVDYKGSASLDEVIKSPFYKKILDMPYRVMLFWAHGGNGKNLHTVAMTPDQEEGLYKEFFELTKNLLIQYNNSGKTFMIGNWEGDWLAGGFEMAQKVDIDPVRLVNFRKWLDVRCKAIDDAKADTPHENVRVYSYIEVNHVVCARVKGLKRVVNAVLPYSSVDYISLSSYDYQGFYQWPLPATEASLKSLVVDNLDYVESLLPPRDVPGKRVFIGEIGYTWEEIMKRTKVTLEQAKREQVRLFLMQAKVNFQWGTPLWLWWATFSSHEGTFGLVDNVTNEPTELHGVMKAYFAWAVDYSKKYEAEHKKTPPFDVFRKAAIEQLDRQLKAYQ